MMAGPTKAARGVRPARKAAMRELKPGLAERSARSAPIRYKLAGGAASLTLHAVLVPAASLLLDPGGQSVAAFLAIGLASSFLLVWGYYVATGMMVRRRLLD